MRIANRWEMHPRISRSWVSNRPRGFWGWIVLCLAVAGNSGDAQESVPRNGAELAARVRSSAPTVSTELTGVLQVRKKNNALIRSLPVHSRVEPGTNQWQVSYEIQSTPTNGILGERLLILRSSATPGIYLFSRDSASSAGSPTNLPTPVDFADLGTALGGTEFCFGDLGLEFLHWPTQRVLTNEMRGGRSCRVLESTTSTPWAGGYSRVVAWVDVETDGILMAHAYDANGTWSKEFSVGRVKKVEGRWELQSMKMKNVRTGQSTELEFNHR